MTSQSVSNQKTIQQIIDSTSQKTKERNTGEMGKDDFLNLLVTQLKYQDPLQPVDDKEFIAQMAQFSSLEQMQNMNSSFSSVKAFNLIGKNITASIKDDTTGELNSVQGNVSSVKMNSGKTYVVVKGQDIPIDSVTNVDDTVDPFETNISQYVGIIGTAAQGSVYNSNGEVANVKGIVKSIQKGVYEDYAVMDGVEATLGDIVTDSPSTDPMFKVNYLRDNTGNKIKVKIVDPDTGAAIAVEAVLDSYSTDDGGKTTAVLSKLNVPVDSIVRLSKP